MNLNSNTHSVLGLMYDLDQLWQARLTNQRFRIILNLQEAVNESAALARTRILQHAFDVLKAEVL